MLDDIARDWVELFTVHIVGVTILVLIVLAADRLFTLGTRARYRLWLLCLIKCLVPPFLILSSPRPETFPTEGGLVVFEGAAVAGRLGTEVSGVLPSTILFLAWMLSAFLFGAWVATRNVRFQRQVKRAQTVSQQDLPVDTAGLSVVEMEVGSPFLVGLRRPTLVLPRKWRLWDPDFLKAVIAHEQSHLRSRDLWTLLGEQLATCTLWFHPAVWIVRRNLHLIREFRSDETVVAVGPITNALYAERLVDLLQEGRRRHTLLNSVGLQSSALSKRVHHLLSKEAFTMRIRKHHHALVVGVALLLVPLSISGVEQTQSNAADDSGLRGSSGVLNEVEFFQLAKEKKPVRVKNVNPIYPEDARKKGLQGRVFVRFRIGIDGKVDSAHVLKGATIFHDAALEAIRQSEFVPATLEGVPVAVWMTQAIRFARPNSGADSATSMRGNGQPVLMELWVSSADKLLLDKNEEVSLDQAVSELRARLKKSGLREAMLRSAPDVPGLADKINRSSVHAVSILAEQKVNGEFLQDVIQKLRQEKVELRITIQ